MTFVFVSRGGIAVIVSGLCISGLASSNNQAQVSLNQSPGSNSSGHSTLLGALFSLLGAGLYSADFVVSEYLMDPSVCLFFFSLVS